MKKNKKMPNNNINPDRILVFDLKGPFAHFRKYYTNTSSLSYSFPPRTVIIGLIAGLLDKQRDSYYEDFDDTKCLIGVSIKTPLRRIMQKVNYTNTKPSGFKNPENNYNLKNILKGTTIHTQIPLEILRPVNGYEIRYRIYFWHENDVYDKLKGRLIQDKFAYPPYLGITEFLGEIEYIGEGKIEKRENEKEFIDINTICRRDNGEKPSFNGNDLQYLMETMPANFSRDREVTRYSEYVFEKNCKPLLINLKEFYRLQYTDKLGCIVIENIVFM